MRFKATAIAGAYVVDMEPICDERGYFGRMFCTQEFLRHGIDVSWVQVNTSFNIRKGTLRGLHYQSPPLGEDKLVRCTRGSIFDVIADLRRNSPSYGGVFSAVLTESEGNMLFIPAGCAHGFQTLADSTTVLYMMSEYYDPHAGRGVRYDDARLGIPWPIADIVISERDRAFGSFEQEAALMNRFESEATVVS